MKNPLLILITILTLACNPNERSISVQTPLHSLKTAGTHFSRYDHQSLAWFLQLAEEGTAIPHSLIEKHTLIVHPYGVFEGEGTRPVNDNIKAVILRHRDDSCIRHFVLTTNGRTIIDQRLVAETCESSEESALYTYSDFAFVEQNFVGTLTFQLDPSQQNPKEKLIKKTGFRIMKNGVIETASASHVKM